MRVVAEHRCAKQHRSAAAFAKCAWPNATEILGQGQLAIVTTCFVPRVFLVERLRPARILRSELNVFGCGPNCVGSHELLAIDYDAPLPSETTFRAESPSPTRGTA